MKKLMLSLIACAALALVLGTGIGLAKSKTCPMCPTDKPASSVCSMCNSKMECKLTVKAKDAKYCCGMCGDTKVKAKDCQTKCAMHSEKK